MILIINMKVLLPCLYTIINAQCVISTLVSGVAPSGVLTLCVFQVTDMTNGNKKPSKWKSKVRQNRCHIVAEVPQEPNQQTISNIIISRQNSPSSSWVLTGQPPMFFLSCSSPSIFSTGRSTSSSCQPSSK